MATGPEDLSTLRAPKLLLFNLKLPLHVSIVHTVLLVLLLDETRCLFDLCCYFEGTFNTHNKIRWSLQPPIASDLWHTILFPLHFPLLSDMGSAWPILFCLTEDRVTYRPAHLQPEACRGESVELFVTDSCRGQVSG